MSTNLHQAVQKGLILEWGPQLGPRDLAFRRLLVTREFKSWLDTLPAKTTHQRRLISPIAELNEIAARFVAGKPVITFMSRIDPPTGEGVLRLKTMSSSFGLLGWCHEPQTLILAYGGSAAETHKRHALRDLGKKVVDARRALGLTWTKGEFYELFRAQG